MRIGDRGDRPPRPSLPPVLVAALALWAVTAVVYPALRGWPPPGLIGTALAATLAAVALAVMCARRRAVPLPAVVILAALVAVDSSALSAWGLARAMGEAGEAHLWRCTLTTDAKTAEFGARATAWAESDAGSMEVRLNLPSEGVALMQGEVLAVRGSLSAPSAAAAPYFWNEGLAGSLTVRDEIDVQGFSTPLAAFRARAVELVGESGVSQGALIQALVCGYRAPLEAGGGYESFKTVGLAHLVAVSGAHLSIVAMFVTGSLRLIGLGRRGIAVAMAVFLAAYVCFTGMPVSALRAAVMAAAGVAALAADRRSSALAALGACIVLFAAARPASALSASFALSAGSTLGIVLLAPLFASWVPRLGRRARSLVADPLVLTLASFAATQPYAASLFAQVPLLSPLANVVAAPLFALGCVIGFVAVLAALVVPVLAPVALGASSAALLPLAVAVEGLAALPGSCLPVDADPLLAVCMSAVLLGTLWAWWPSPSPKALVAGLGAVGAAAVLALGAPSATAADEIVMLDVGQGDAFLVRSQGSALLVDTGNQDVRLREACARQGVHRLDRVVVSHPDDDHCGSLSALGDVADVGGLLVAADLLECPCDQCGDLRSEAAGEAYRAGVAGLSLGDRVRCGRFTLEVVWPSGFRDEGGNGDSLTFLCSFDGDGDGVTEWTALLCGDAEAEQLDAMAPSLPENGVDVLKVGHHGSRRSLDAATMARLSPSVALISVGEGNRYGHPAPDVCALLENGGAEVFRTDLMGDVAVAFSMEKIAVRPQHAGVGP